MQATALSEGEGIGNRVPVAEQQAVSEPPKLGTLTVEITGEGNPIDGASLLLFGPKPSTTVRMLGAPSGSASFDRLLPGDYGMVAADLPPEWLPPRPTSGASGRQEFPVRIHAGVQSLVLQLERSVRVFGSLCGEPTDPPRELEIVFMHFGEPRAEYHEPYEFPVVDGRFEGGVYAGAWFAEVHDKNGEPVVTGTRFEPRIVKIEPGAGFRVDIECDRGSGSILGRVLDGDGKPFVGLHIGSRRIMRLPSPGGTHDYLSEREIGDVITGSDGSFSIVGLAPAEYRLIVEPDRFHVFAQPGTNRIGAPIEDKIDLTELGSQHVEITALRSHLVHVQGTIEVDRTWAQQQGCVDQFPSAEIVIESPHLDLLEAESGLDTIAGRFEFYVEAAAPRPVIRLELKGTTESYPLRPFGGADPEPLVLRFPK